MERDLRPYLDMANRNARHALTQRDAARAALRDLRAAVADALANLAAGHPKTAAANLRAALAAHPEPDAAQQYAEDGAPHALVPGTSTDDPPGYPGDPRWCDRCGRAADDQAHADPTPPAHPEPDAGDIPTDSGLGYWYREPDAAPFVREACDGGDDPTLDHAEHPWPCGDGMALDQRRTAPTPPALTVTREQHDAAVQAACAEAGWDWHKMPADPSGLTNWQGIPTPTACMDPIIRAAEAALGVTVVDAPEVDRG